VSDERHPHLERFVTASELGDYAYCRRAWWLRAVQGLETDEHSERFERGHARHRAHARTLRVARALLGIAVLLVLAALALVVALR
jgi:hypothetical protein